MTVETLQVGLDSTRAGEYRFGLVRVPVWPARLFVPLGLAGLTVVLVMRAIHAAKTIVSRTPARQAD